MNKFLNIVGQIRFYSLVDLILLFFAIGSKNIQVISIVFLHLGFIFYLEFVHKHSYRVKLNSSIWIFLSLVGVFLYPSWYVFGFALFSFLYAHKDKKMLGPFSSFFRGLQLFFLVSVVAPFSAYAFLACGLLFLRNFIGDLRDIVKDSKEKMRTLPIVLGFKKDIKYLHLIFVLITSFIWWYISGFGLLILLLVYLIEVGSYYLTSR